MARSKYKSEWSAWDKFMRGLSGEALSLNPDVGFGTPRSEPISSIWTWLGLATLAILCVIGLLLVVQVGHWLFP